MRKDAPMLSCHRIPDSWRSTAARWSIALAHRQLIRESISDEDLQTIRRHVQQQRALGSSRFQAAIEAMNGRCASVRPCGRPARIPAQATTGGKMNLLQFVKLNSPTSCANSALLFGP
jgi:hypothetical protein